MNQLFTQKPKVQMTFLKYLLINLHICIYNDFYRRPIPLKLTHAEQISFDKAEICHICKKEFLTDNGVDKVRDHCHFTGQYRGAAHNSCNLQCRKPMILPVIFHNLQGYDAHLFIKQLELKLKLYSINRRKVYFLFQKD